MPKREDLRRLAQQQNLNAYQKFLQAQTEKSNSGVVRIGVRDTATGKDEVIYQNGNKEIAGVRTFNASVANGSIVRATRPYGSPIVAIDRTSAFIEEILEEIVEPLKKQQVYPFKILFSIVENGKRKFYVGGDRALAKFLFEVEVEN